MTDANKMREALRRLVEVADWTPVADSSARANLTAAIFQARAALAEQPAQGATATGPRFTYGHCADRRQVGGCTRHNLYCGYPDCDRKEVPHG